MGKLKGKLVSMSSDNAKLEKRMKNFEDSIKCINK